MWLTMTAFVLKLSDFVYIFLESAINLPFCGHFERRKSDETASLMLQCLATISLSRRQSFDFSSSFIADLHH